MTSEVPAQQGNLTYSIFRQQTIVFHPPGFNPWRQISQAAMHQKQQISRHPDTTHCLKALQSCFYLPV